MTLDVIKIKFVLITNEYIFYSNTIERNYYQIQSQVKPNEQRVSKNQVEYNLLSV